MGPEELRLQGHWLLAKIGKKVLRPGGMEMTRRLLDHASPSSEDRIVELGPGVGKTAELLLRSTPERYCGIDVNKDPDNPLQTIVSAADNAELVIADAKDTGLADGWATMVIGEAMLTMQSDKDKLSIMRESHRMLAPGGRYIIHEMGFAEDTPSDVMTSVERTLSRTIKVGARPLTGSSWIDLLEQAGFVVEFSTTNPMALLEIPRLVRDEGWSGFFRILFNVSKNPAARKRVFQMRKVFKDNQRFICAVGFVATKR